MMRFLFGAVRTYFWALLLLDKLHLVPLRFHEIRVFTRLVEIHDREAPDIWRPTGLSRPKASIVAFVFATDF